MELNLVPQEADQTVFEGDGGGYYSWSTSKFPLLGEAKLGAGKLVLKPRGFALPHFADSAKIGYVLQGCCTVGMIAHNTSKENVLIINKGDAIPVPLGGVSWWFNSGDSDVVILFLGETSKAHTPGQFTYFLLAGTLGFLQGFSTEFVSRAYNINEEEAHLLVNSQTGVLIVKLEEGINMPQPCKDNTKEGLVANIDEVVPAVAVKNGGSLSLVTSENFPVLGQVGLGASLAKLEANAMLAPMYTADSSVQMVYVSSGSGRVQMVGFNGQNVLDTKVQAGKLFVVPKFFTVSVIAEGEGMKCFSILTTSKPLFGQLAGKTSVLKALSPSVLQASLNVTPQFEELFKSKSERNTVIIPPKN